MHSMYAAYQDYLALTVIPQDIETYMLMATIEAKAQLGEVIYFPDRPELSIYSWESAIDNCPEDVREQFYNTNWF